MYVCNPDQYEENAKIIPASIEVWQLGDNSEDQSGVAVNCQRTSIFVPLVVLVTAGLT